MNNIEPDNQFVSEEELRALLERWQPPDASELLEKRVSSSYLREMSGAGIVSNSLPLPKTDNEVVTMKFCSKCQEEFADKFSFCPVDGTPLNLIDAQLNEPSITVGPGDGDFTNEEAPSGFGAAASAASAAAGTAGALAARGEYHLTIMSDTGLVSRLAGEIKDVAHQYELTWPEFKRDPVGFVKRSAVGYGQMATRSFGNRNAMVAIGVAVLAMFGLVGAIKLLDRSSAGGSSRFGIIAFSVVAFLILVGMFATWLGRERGAAVMGAQPSDSRNVAFAMVTAFLFLFAILGSLIWVDRRHQKDVLAAKTQDDMEVQQFIDIPPPQPTPDVGTAGMAKGSGGGSKPKQEKAGGGGGGGREEAKPASAGKLPQVDLRIPQVVAPDPHPPVIKNPVLPVAATLDADPKLFPPDARNLPYGDPKSKSTDISSGSGTGNGIGDGKGGGVGPGSGGGYGPGNGGNTGGGDRHEGGGGAGGGGTDYNKVFSSREVSQKARVLSKPEPGYTEDARKNQVTGTVILKVVFTSSGTVTQITALRPLPYGLTEKAIAAARGIKFIPATKDGHNVSMYMQLEYSFNLY